MSIYDLPLMLTTKDPMNIIRLLPACTIFWNLEPDIPKKQCKTSLRNVRNLISTLQKEL